MSTQDAVGTAVVAAMRNGMVEYGRFAAALAIVWSTSQAPGSRYVQAALPCFLVLLALPVSQGLIQRLRSLVLPFISWCLVFALLRIALSLKHGDPALGWWDANMIFSGTWNHLWVLPFIFVMTLVAPWFNHPLASMGAAFLAAFLIATQGTPDVFPFGEWSFGLIPILVGIAFFSWGWRLAVITLLGSFLILQVGRPSPDNLTILLGTGLALACLMIRLPATPLSDWCARVSIWVYLAHPLVIILGQSLRITWFELGLFSLVGSVMLAQLLTSAAQASRKGGLEF